MPDWELEPTRGPWPYLGSGLMVAIGGSSLLWAQMTALGTVVLAAGLLITVLATRRLLRERRFARQEP